MKYLRARIWAAVIMAVLLAGPSCILVEYSDALVDESTGRGNLVTQPASIGGIVGFIAGVPLDILALPATYVVYQAQKDEDEEGVDPLSTLLFPSFVLWRAGVLIVGIPFDAVEWTFVRAWEKPRAKLQPEYDAELTEGVEASAGSGRDPER